MTELVTLNQIVGVMHGVMFVLSHKLRPNGTEAQKTTNEKNVTEFYQLFSKSYGSVSPDETNYVHDATLGAFHFQSAAGNQRITEKFRLFKHWFSSVVG